MAYLGDINSAAHYGAQVLSLIAVAQDARDRAHKLKLIADQITTGGTTNFTGLETEFGLPIAQGQNWYNNLVAYITDIEPGGIVAALLTAAG